MKVTKDIPHDHIPIIHRMLSGLENVDLNLNYNIIIQVLTSVVLMLL